MLAAQRRQEILAAIAATGASTIIELSRKFDVSEMTIRRDLQALEVDGHIKRTHGGAIRGSTPLVEPRYVAKQKLHASAKTRIAQFAAEELVEDGDIIILEGGTTVTLMARFLTSKVDLTVVTNGLYTTSELRILLPRATIICTGGILRDVSSTFVGPIVERFFQEFHANKVFLSATGLTLDAGFTDPNMLETQSKKAMIQSADRRIMLLDPSKFGIKSLMTVLDANKIDVLVTAEGAPEELLDTLRDAGAEVRKVPDNSAF